MDHTDPGFIHHAMEIPTVFHSSATGGPFTACVVCGVHLLDSGRQYVIEKAIRRYDTYAMQDTIFEYAMCMPCFESMQDAMSTDSLQRVQQYFESRIDLSFRRDLLLRSSPPVIDDWVSSCLITGTPQEELGEYQLFCQCDGRDLLFTHLPYMIGGPVIDEVADLLSNKTLGEIDGFMDRHFGLPPELRKKLMDRPMLVI